VFRQGADALVQFLAQIADGLGIFCQGFLSPSVGDRLEQGDQGRRRGQDDPLFHTALDQGRVGLERRAVERLPRNEQHDEFRAGTKFPGQMLPIGFLRQLAHVIAQLAGMVEQFQFGGGGLTLGFQFSGAEIGIQRGFGVDGDALAARQPDDQIRTQSAAIALHAGLLGEIAVLQHAGQFDHPLELDFPPTTAHRRLPQGLHQAGGFPMQLRQVVLEQGFELLVQGAVGIDAGLFHLTDAQIHLRQ